MDGNSGDGLAVESAKMSFIAGEEGLAPVLDRGGEDRSVFFRQEQSEVRGRKRGRTREASDSAQEALEIGQDGGEFLFQISPGLGDHIFIGDAFMAASLDFLDESADGSGGFGRGEKDIGVEENTHRLRTGEGWVFLKPSGQIGLGLIEFGDALVCVNLDGHGDCRAKEYPLWRGFSDEVVLGP